MAATVVDGQETYQQDKGLYLWLLDQMCDEPRLNAWEIARSLHLKDLAWLARRLRPNQTMTRGPVAQLAETFVERDAENAPKQKAGYEWRVELLIQLGRVKEDQRTRAIEETWAQLGLSKRQERVVKVMVGQPHQKLGWVEHVSDAPWLEVSVDRGYLDNKPVKLVLVEAGESKEHVEVEVEIAVDVPPIVREIPADPKVLGVSVIVVAKPDLLWNLRDGGTAILTKALDRRDVSALRMTA